MVEFSRCELAEISDVISAALDKTLAAGDPDHNETKSGTLTLLHEAQAKIFTGIFSFGIDDTTWGPERANAIAALRRAQGLPKVATTQERMKWQMTLSR